MPHYIKLNLDMQEPTTIRISKETRQVLASRGIKTETYDDILKRILGVKNER
jgi:hypothetical protein